MQISLLQLNINADNFWEKLTTFLLSHDFDVMHLQELTGKDTINGNINSKRDCFAELSKILAKKYHGELVSAESFTSSPHSYIGNAIFYKKSFPLIKKHSFFLHERKTPFSSEAETFEEEGRVFLHLTLNMSGKPVSFLTTHGAWAKTSIEEPHQAEQGKMILSYLKTVPRPFLFSADMNLDPQQPLIKKIETLAQNLVPMYGITNTLNPRTHRAKHLFPIGLAVDYIFVSPDCKVKSFSVVEEDLSDHFGLITEVEI